MAAHIHSDLEEAEVTVSTSHPVRSFSAGLSGHLLPTSRMTGSSGNCYTSAESRKLKSPNIIRPQVQLRFGLRGRPWGALREGHGQRFRLHLFIPHLSFLLSHALLGHCCYYLYCSSFYRTLWRLCKGYSKLGALR